MILGRIGCSLQEHLNVFMKEKDCQLGLFELWLSTDQFDVSQIFLSYLSNIPSLEKYAKHYIYTFCS